MMRVDITLNSRKYPITCDQSHEGRVQELADYVNSRIADLVRSGTPSSEAHLLAMVSIILADELFDMAEEIRRLRDGGAAAPASAAAAPPSYDTDPAFVAGVDRLARRLDELAARLERA